MRREDLLRTACDVIVERGFGRARTIDVAKAAGVSQALLFYHFESREKLFAEAFAYAANRDLEGLGKLEESEGSPVERLSGLCKLYLPSARSKSWALWIDAWSESMRDHDLEKVSRALDLRWKRALQAILEDGVAQGVFRCPDPEGATWRLLSMIDGLAVQITVHKRVLTRARVAELVRAAAASEIGLSAELLK